jgi:mono/diheme cytochrome c family protein
MRRAAPLLLAGLLLAGCQEKVGPSSPFNVPWSTDMYTQPSLYPQEWPQDQAPGAVPVTADPPALPHMVAAERLKNPVPMSKASVERGKAVYASFCVPCHGATGKGDGPVAPKFVAPPPLDGAAQKGRTDGYIYATVRQGSLSQLMPAYGYRMSEQERWDVVNYVRSLQGVVAQADEPAPTRESALPAGAGAGTPTREAANR